MKRRLFTFMLVVFAGILLVSCDLTGHDLTTYDSNTTTTEGNISSTTTTYGSTIIETTDSTTLETTEITTTQVTYYQVTFMLGDEILKTETVIEGEAATAPTDPEKESTDQYDYSFNGWSQDFDSVQSDMVVVAMFEETLRSYSVTFYDYDGSLLATATVEYGSSAIAPADPQRTGDAQYSYVFSNWSLDFSEITGELDIYAEYEEILNQYTVSFYNYDGTELDSQSVYYGFAAQAPATPSREGDVQYSYTFNGWDVEFDFIVGNLDVYATFEETVNQYMVCFYDYDRQTLLQSDFVDYGNTAAPPTEPARQSEGIYDYAFYAWIGDFSYIVEDTNIYASYTRTFHSSETYQHSLFYELTATVFDLDDSAIIEQNILYLIDILEAETEEEAYNIFYTIVISYEELFNFGEFQELKDLIFSFDSGAVTQDDLITYAINYLQYEQNYMIGKNSVWVNWFNECDVNYHSYLAEVTTYLNNMEAAFEPVNTLIAGYASVLQATAQDYSDNYLVMFNKEKERFAQMDELRLYIDRTIVANINTAIWQILHEDTIDPALYDYYLGRYNYYLSEYSEYSDLIIELKVMTEEYIYAIDQDEILGALIDADPTYDGFKSAVTLACNTYYSSKVNYDLIIEDFEYWEYQYTALKSRTVGYGEINDIFNTTENLDLYREALNILIDEIQAIVINANNQELDSLGAILYYMNTHADMYNFIDFGDLFNSVTTTNVFDTIHGLKNLIDGRYSTIDENDLVVLNNALDALIDDYLNETDLNEAEKAALNLEYHTYVFDFASNLNLFLDQLSLLLESIELSEIETWQAYLLEDGSVDLNAYVVALAGVFDDIFEDDPVNLEDFVYSYIYMNYFQENVHIDFTDLLLVQEDVLSRLNDFIDLADTVVGADPNIMDETEYSQLINDFLQEYYYFWQSIYNSYRFYLE